MAFKRFRAIIYYLFSLYLLVITLFSIENELIKKIVHYGFLVVTGISIGVAISAYYLNTDRDRKNPDECPDQRGGAKQRKEEKDEREKQNKE